MGRLGGWEVRWGGGIEILKGCDFPRADLPLPPSPVIAAAFCRHRGRFSSWVARNVSRVLAPSCSGVRFCTDCEFGGGAGYVKAASLLLSFQADVTNAERSPKCEAWLMRRVASKTEKVETRLKQLEREGQRRARVCRARVCLLSRQAPEGCGAGLPLLQSQEESHEEASVRCAQVVLDPRVKV